MKLEHLARQQTFIYQDLHCNTAQLESVFIAPPMGDAAMVEIAPHVPEREVCVQ